MMLPWDALTGVDPMAGKFHSLSPYQYAGNNPVMSNDPLGDDFKTWDEVWATAAYALTYTGEGAEAFSPTDIREFGSAQEAMSNTASAIDRSGGWANTVYRTAGNFRSAMAERFGGSKSDWKFNSSVYYDTEYKTYGVEIKRTNANQGGITGAGFIDELGQIMNLGGVVWGSSELGIQAIRHNNGPQLIGRFMGFGTQRTAAALKGTLSTISKAGKYLGAAGQLLNTYAYISKGLDPNQKLTTGDHAGFWTGSAIFTAAAIIGGPITGGIALGYGIVEIGSWLYNGKSIEQNVFDE